MVQDNSDRYLGRGKEEKVDRGEQAEIASAEAKFQRQRCCDQRIDRPEQKGQVTARRERQEYAHDAHDKREAALAMFGSPRCLPRRPWPVRGGINAIVFGNGFSEERWSHGLESHRGCRPPGRQRYALIHRGLWGESLVHHRSAWRRRPGLPASRLPNPLASWQQGARWSPVSAACRDRCAVPLA